MSALLEVSGATVRYGGLAAVDHVDMRVRTGEILALLGPNGAGKTSLFNAIAGLVSLAEGSIWLDGIELTDQPPHVRARLGIGRTFQRVQLFGKLTCLENVLVGAEGATGSLSVIGSAFRTRRCQLREDAARVRAEAALEMVGASDLAARRAETLPFALAKRIELARALASGPRLLMLDEPASGLDEAESSEFASLLRRLRDDLALTILLVEHDVQLVAEASSYAYVLDFGRLLHHGPTQEVLRAPEVVAAYLGTMS